MVGKTLQPGTTINDRYKVVRKLGSYGHVYEAIDEYLDDRPVAVKLLHPDASGVPRPWDEARRLERLRSRFLVDVINADVWAENDIRFIVTPLFSTGDLESAASPNGLAIQESVRYMHQVATGIDRIHADGMIHRDIKPGNVLLGGDGVFVIDLEFCELLDASGKAGPTGTWCTVAPEAAAGDHCSVRSEVYSLGATAFYLLSGAYPVDHKLELGEQRRRIIAGETRELRQIAPHVSQAIGTVIRRALSLDPGARFDSALAFGNALTQAARGVRDWRRVTHPGHSHCLEGSAAHQRAAVTVCAVADGPNFRLQARLANSGRRVANVSDTTVRPAQMARAMQQLVKRLS